MSLFNCIKIMYRLCFSLFWRQVLKIIFFIGTYFTQGKENKMLKKNHVQLHTPTDVCIALYTRCFPSVCGINFTGDSGKIRTHDLLLTSADVLTSRPPSLPGDDRPASSGFRDVYRLMKFLRRMINCIGCILHSFQKAKILLCFFLTDDVFQVFSSKYYLFEAVSQCSSSWFCHNYLHDSRGRTCYVPCDKWPSFDNRMAGILHFWPRSRGRGL